MGDQSQTIETEALSLPKRQRTKLVLKLLDSLEHRVLEDPKQVESAWLDEAKRRYEAYLSGEEQAIPAEQVFDELRAEDH